MRHQHIIAGEKVAQIPFQVVRAGQYRILLTYGSTSDRRVMTLKLDGVVPNPAWANFSLSGTVPDYHYLHKQCFNQGTP